MTTYKRKAQHNRRAHALQNGPEQQLKAGCGHGRRTYTRQDNHQRDLLGQHAVVENDREYYARGSDHGVKRKLDVAVHAMRTLPVVAHRRRFCGRPQ